MPHDRLSGGGGGAVGVGGGVRGGGQARRGRTCQRGAKPAAARRPNARFPRRPGGDPALLTQRRATQRRATQRPAAASPAAAWGPRQVHRRGLRAPAARLQSSNASMSTMPSPASTGATLTFSPNVRATQRPGPNARPNANDTTSPDHAPNAGMGSLRRAKHPEETSRLETSSPPPQGTQRQMWPVPPNVKRPNAQHPTSSDPTPSTRRRPVDPTPTALPGYPLRPFACCRGARRGPFYGDSVTSPSPPGAGLVINPSWLGGPSANQG